MRQYLWKSILTFGLLSTYSSPSIRLTEMNDWLNCSTKNHPKTRCSLLNEREGRFGYDPLPSTLHYFCDCGSYWAYFSDTSWYSALFFFLGLLLEILVLNILYSGLYIFVIALLSLISNCFIERFCSSFVEGFCLSHHLAM